MKKRSLAILVLGSSCRRGDAVRVRGARLELEERRDLQDRDELAHRFAQPVRRLQPGRVLDVHVHLSRSDPVRRAEPKFVPDFARSWKTSKDGKTWTFTTVANAKWSDGKPLTAADARGRSTRTSSTRARGAANAAGLIAHIKRAEAPNPTTLVVHYSAAAGNVLGQFQQFAILPKHIWSKHTGHKGNDLKTFANSAPVVGAGPFKLVKFKKDEIALFQRDNSFYGPKPQADGFGLRMFSNDDALVAALKANEIDAIEDVPATAIKTLKNAGMNVTNVPGVDQTDFIFNSNPKKPKRRELLNPKVREAFDHAVDREQDRQRGLPRHREAGRFDHPAGDRCLVQQHVEDRELRSRQGEQDPRRPRLQEGRRRDPHGQRPQDVVSGDHADGRLERRPRRSRSCRRTFARSACSSRRRHSTRAPHSTPSPRRTGST